MNYIRGWIGLGIFLISIPLWVWKPTRGFAPLALGFGLGMMSSGFR